MSKFNINDIYDSFEEDLIDELTSRYPISQHEAKLVLQINKFKERFMSKTDQFDYFELCEIADIFYDTYLYNNGSSHMAVSKPRRKTVTEVPGMARWKRKKSTESVGSSYL